MATEPAKTHKKSYMLACGASLCMGMACYFMADLSLRKGVLGVPCQGFGFILVWAIYWMVRFIGHKRKNPNRPFLTKKDSQYYEEFIDDDLPADSDSLEIEEDVESPEPVK
jgi:hypothetical protein